MLAFFIYSVYYCYCSFLANVNSLYAIARPSVCCL